jgi:hypothetical protein
MTDLPEFAPELPRGMLRALRNGTAFTRNLRIASIRERHIRARMLITLWGLSWEECGENPAVFCYRYVRNLL